MDSRNFEVGVGKGAAVEGPHPGRREGGVDPPSPTLWERGIGGGFERLLDCQEGFADGFKGAVGGSQGGLEE